VIVRCCNMNISQMKTRVQKNPGFFKKSGFLGFIGFFGQTGKK